MKPIMNSLMIHSICSCNIYLISLEISFNKTPNESSNETDNKQLNGHPNETQNESLTKHHSDLFNLQL